MATITAPTPGLSDLVGNTAFDLERLLPNDETLESIGVYSTVAASLAICIASLNAGQAVVSDVISMSHGGGGWQDAPVSFSVPASGTHMIGVYAGEELRFNRAQARALATGQASGTATVSEDVGDLTAIRFTTQEATVPSQEITLPNGAVIPADGVIFPVFGVIRPLGAGSLTILDDSGHKPLNITGVSISGSAIRLTYPAASKVGVLNFTVDETLAAVPWHCGASVGLSYADIWLYGPNGAIVGASGWSNGSSNIWVNGWMWA